MENLLNIELKANLGTKGPGATTKDEHKTRNATIELFMIYKCLDIFINTNQHLLMPMKPLLYCTF